VAHVVLSVAAAVIAVRAAAVTDHQPGFPGGVRVNRPRLFICRPVKEEHIEIEGRVTTVLPGTMFRVKLDNEHLVLATICGKMRKRFVRLTVGDRVKMEMSPYDLNRARIVWRLR
jgi:translation initiation factor IF-1